MVKIRLQHFGYHKRPFYRIVAASSDAPRDGKFLAIIGTYDPLKEKEQVVINQELLKEWYSKGAVPSDTVKSLLHKHQIGWK
jgi:small subunit ribosomal protein S16